MFKRDTFLRRLFFIILGNSFCSLAINVFFLPNNMLSGGIGGIAIFLNYLWNLPIGRTVFILNIPVFILGFFLLDKKYVFYSILSIFSYSFILDYMSLLTRGFVMDDIILATVFGALFNGIGMGLMFRNGVNQGGFDILALIFKKYLNINIGSALMMFNTLIISMSSIYLGIKPAMYTLICMFIGYKVVDRVQIGLGYSKQVVVISLHAREIQNKLVTELNRASTLFHGEGAISGLQKNALYCTVSSREVAKVKMLVNKIDPTAFFTVSDITEVKGVGFEYSEI